MTVLIETWPDNCANEGMMALLEILAMACQVSTVDTYMFITGFLFLLTRFLLFSGKHYIAISIYC